MSNPRVHQVWKWLQWNCLQSTLRKKKINTLFAGLGRSVLGKTVPSVLSTQDLWHSFSQYGPPGRQITYKYFCAKWRLLFIYNPPINYCGLSLDKTYHVVQIGRSLSEDIRRFDFISTKEKTKHSKRSNSTEHRKRKRFTEASDGEIKKLVDKKHEKIHKIRGNFTVPFEASPLRHLLIFLKIFQPWALSFDIPAAEKGLFSLLNKCIFLPWVRSFPQLRSNKYQETNLGYLMKMSHWWDLGLTVSLISWK